MKGHAGKQTVMPNQCESIVSYCAVTEIHCIIIVLYRYSSSKYEISDRQVMKEKDPIKSTS